MVTDPVCGMTIEENKAAATEKYQDTTLYFCSDSCHSKFQANPNQYVSSEEVSDSE